MIRDCKEGLEILDAARKTYRDGEYRRALEMLSELAYYVTSTQRKPAGTPAEIEALRTGVRRALAGFQSCENECVWESASSLFELFRED